MAYIINGSIISDSEFEFLKRQDINKLKIHLSQWEILFIVVLSLATLFLISYGIYDVLHNGYTPTCVCH